MKTLLILMTFLLPNSSLHPAPFCSRRALQVNIEVTVGEHSMDSNSSTRSISINGDKMTYAKTYQGRRGKAQKDFSKEIKLRRSQREALTRLLKQQNLIVSRTVDYPIVGTERYFTFEMHAALDKPESSIKVSGPVNTLENENIYKDITALLEEIEAIVDSR